METKWGLAMEHKFEAGTAINFVLCDHLAH